MKEFISVIYRSSLFRYLWTGGLGFILDIGTLLFLYHQFGVHYQFATLVGFFVGLIAVYLICNAWVFKQRKMKESPIKEFAVFALIGAIGLALTHMLMWLFYEQIELNVTYAKCATTLLVLMWNYGARKIIIY